MLSSPQFSLAMICLTDSESRSDDQHSRWLIVLSLLSFTSNMGGMISGITHSCEQFTAVFDKVIARMLLKPFLRIKYPFFSRFIFTFTF